MILSRLFGKSDRSTEMLCPHCERAMESTHDVEACARKRMSRRRFFALAGGAAAVAALPQRQHIPGNGSLFNPVADVAAQYKKLRFFPQHFVVTGVETSSPDCPVISVWPAVGFDGRPTVTNPIRADDPRIHRLGWLRRQEEPIEVHDVITIEGQHAVNPYTGQPVSIDNAVNHYRSRKS